MLFKLLILGEVIKEYPADKPYPGFLVLGYMNKRAIHVVVARNDSDSTCIIVTTYHPSSDYLGH